MKKFFLVLFLVLVLVPSIFALTEFRVKTLPSHKILITVLVPESQEIYKVIVSSSPFKFVGSTGDFIYNPDKKVDAYEKVDLKITLKLGDKTLLNERVYNVKTGGIAYINYKPGNISVYYPDSNSASTGSISTSNTSDTTNNSESSQSVEENTNETTDNTPAEANEEVGTQENDQKKASPVTGFLTLDNKSLIYTIIIIASIVFVIIIIIIIVLIVMLKRKSSDDSQVDKIKFRHKENDKPNDKDIARAERKLYEAREEINKLRKREDMIKDAERKLEEDMQRLERLKKGEY